MKLGHKGLCTSIIGRLKYPINREKCDYKIGTQIYKIQIFNNYLKIIKILYHF